MELLVSVMQKVHPCSFIFKELIRFFSFLKTGQHICCD